MIQKVGLLQLLKDFEKLRKTRWVYFAVFIFKAIYKWVC